MIYPFVTGIAGVSFRQDAVRDTKPGDTVLLRREPDNPYDADAIAVFSAEGRALGYLPAAVAKRIEADVPALDGIVEEVLEGNTWGLRVKVIEATNATTVNTRTETTGQDRVWIYSKSGRRLGYELEQVGSQVVVINGEGSEVRYPAAVVERRSAHS